MTRPADGPYVTGDRLSHESRLLHSFREGLAKAPATASDYANMIWAAVRLHEATAELGYFEQAMDWTDLLDRHYWIADHGGYATSADDTCDVIVRLRPGSDDAMPNSNAIMIPNLVALATLSGEARYGERASAILVAFSSELNRNVIAHTGRLAGAMDLVAPQQVVLAGRDLRDGKRLLRLSGLFLCRAPNNMAWVAQSALNYRPCAISRRLNDGRQLTHASDLNARSP
jgi:uncharacterized protein YyaL (SSP411 family)